MSSVASPKSDMSAAAAVSQGAKVSKLSTAIAASLSSSKTSGPTGDQKPSADDNPNQTPNQGQNQGQNNLGLASASPSNSFSSPGYNGNAFRSPSFGSAPYHSEFSQQPSKHQTGNNAASYSGSPMAMVMDPSLRSGNNPFSSDNAAARSPASSMIFERSVQDNFLTGSPSFNNRKFFPSNFGSCQNHHAQEDFIPPVLDASTQALSKNNINPDNINVISARHPSMISLSGPGSPVNAYNNEYSGNPLSKHRTNSSNNPGLSSSLSRNSSGSNLAMIRNTLSNSGLSSPNNFNNPISPLTTRNRSRSNSVQTQNRRDNNNGGGLDQSRETNDEEDEASSVLSFYSFADVVKNEVVSNPNLTVAANQTNPDSNNITSSSEPTGPISRRMSTSSNYIPHTAMFTKHQLNNCHGDQDNWAVSFQDENDDDDGLHMSSLGDTLRKCSISVNER